MRKKAHLFLLLCVVACHANRPDHRTKMDAVKKEDNSPKILIDSAANAVYTENELEDFSKRYPVLIDEISSSPEVAYANLRCHPTQEDAGFNSEAGQDGFYLIYSYFLKKKNVGQGQRRERLLKLYRSINEIYGELAQGGTYFGHQFNRIPAFVEYDLYCLAPADSSLIYKNIKSLYIGLFKEEIKNTVSEDNELGPATEKKLLKEVDKLALLITDYTDLMLVRKFQYSHY
ncbi:hypothetical protein [Chitinophaga sp.]|uniref:hypothetical protein n=1 Tax=Chitinophaga sp. TaxID=1869181 RepID=UPI0031D365AF